MTKIILSISYHNQKMFTITRTLSSYVIDYDLHSFLVLTKSLN